MNKIGIILLLLVIIIGSANSIVVINSNDWRVIYLGIEYSKLKNDNYLVISNPKDINDLNGDVTIIQEEGKEKIPGLYETLKTNNRNTKLISSNSITGLEEKLFDTKNYCVVDSNFGYNAVSLSSQYKKCTIIFYNRSGINKLVHMLKNSNVTLYVDDGFLIDKLKDIGVQPNIINKTFENINLNSIEEANNTLVALMNITEIDPTLLFNNPIILSIDNTTSVIKVLNKSNVKILEVVGINNLQKAIEIKDSLNKHISILLKYGKVSISQGKASTSPLDLYNFRELVENLTIVKAYYNIPTQSIVLIFKNMGTAPLFFYSMEVNSFKDNHLHKINVGETVSIPYKAKFSKKVSGVTSYGYSILNKFVNGSSWNLKVTKTYYQQPNISIKNVYFNESDYCFYIEIKNKGDNPVYVDGEIYNFVKDGKNTTYSFNGTKKVISNGYLKIPIDAQMKDLLKNKKISLAVYYGSNSTILTSYMISNTKYKIISEESNEIEWLLIILIAISAFIFLSVLKFKKKQKRKRK